MAFKVAITVGDFGQSYDEGIKVLEDNGFKVDWVKTVADSNDENLLIKELKGYNALISGGEHITEKVLNELKDDLKIIARHGIGYDKIEIDKSAQMGIPVANAPGSNTDAVAEQAMALTISLMRSVIVYDERTRKGDWINRTMTDSLYGKTIGLLGFGTIARQYARLLKPFTDKIYTYDPYPNYDLAKELGVTFVRQDQLLAMSDIVSVHVPLMESTEGMVNKDFISNMKKGAYIINTARGKIINESDLVDALESGYLAGAGLDVFEYQPLDEESKLTKMDNVVLSPHVASFCHQAFTNMMMMSVENILDYFSGKEPRYIVNSR